MSRFHQRILDSLPANFDVAFLILIVHHQICTLSLFNYKTNLNQGILPRFLQIYSMLVEAHLGCRGVAHVCCL